MANDTILYAVTATHKYISQLAPSEYGYSVDTKYHFLLLLDIMRDHLKADDFQGFSNYCQTKLKSKDGDSMCAVLDFVFSELCISTWDELTNIKEAA